MVDKGKSKVVDKGKGKGKVTEPEKPAFIPLWTSGALKIFELKGPVPKAPPATEPVNKTSVVKKKLAKTPPQVARVLKLVDEVEDLEDP